MINRRFLRIKVFQALYGFFKDASAQQPVFKKNLLDSLNKTYELYLFCLTLLNELHHFTVTELEIQQKKFFPSPDIINPLKAIMQNKLIIAVGSNQIFADKIKKMPAKWPNATEFLRKIFLDIKSETFVTHYAAIEQPGLKDDKVFLTALFEHLFANNELFNSTLEEIYMNWEDDMVTVLLALQKTIKGFDLGKSNFLQDMHKDAAEDLKFVNDLFDLTIEHNKELAALIAEKTENWDEDRIAFVDNLLMKLALSEMLYFPYIPVKVSINEYLEIAKLYSTSNSHIFINGVLDRIQLDLKQQNKIIKLGRGLKE